GQLAQLGFRVRGWCRHPHGLAGVDSFHGSAGLTDFLRATEILVCALPLTAQTCGLLDRGVFAALPTGARLVHMGSRRQCVLPHLLAALDGGQLAHATFDDTEEPQEPCPLRQHPRVTLTPQVVGRLRPETGAALVARNLQRWARDEALLDAVDRARGY
ncbi:MAG TPA: NAD(P)-dependent oxidoreductase, partial [Burkholderiaceae bacterium]|nr:NAD(P)-dependent oxidoreductase [Burkholderiaceae bacterium]